MKRTAFQLAPTEQQASAIAIFGTTAAAQSTIISFTPGEFIVRTDAELSDVLYIISGKCKIVKTEANGTRIIVHFMRAGDFIGELTLVGAEEETKDVVAMSPVVCVAVPMNYAQATLMRDNDFLQMISRQIGTKLLQRIAHYTASQAYELKYRLAELLLQVSVDGIYGERQTEIAEYLGVSYRHLLFTVHNFRQAGLMVKEGSHYRIDVTGLRALLSKQTGILKKH